MPLPRGNVIPASHPNRFCKSRPPPRQAAGWYREKLFADLPVARKVKESAHTLRPRRPAARVRLPVSIFGHTGSGVSSTVQHDG